MRVERIRDATYKTLVRPRLKTGPTPFKPIESKESKKESRNLKMMR